LWSLLILLSVLAPAGQFGITQTPTDTVQLTAPGARSVALQRRLDVDQELQVEVALAPVALDVPSLRSSPVSYVHTPAVVPARTFASSASPRGPPV